LIVSVDTGVIKAIWASGVENSSVLLWIGPVWVRPPSPYTGLIWCNWPQDRAIPKIWVPTPLSSPTMDITKREGWCSTRKLKNSRGHWYNAFNPLLTCLVGLT
jgi:hypothetical protein